MTSAKGQKPAAIRDTNIKLVLRLLEEKTCCRSDLAQSAKLSNPALTAIIDELIGMGLIEEGAEVETGRRGRRKVDLVVNPRFAAVAAVDFSSDNIRIAIADFCRNIILRREIADSEIITRTVLSNVIGVLREMLQKTDIAVKCICVGVPGKINAETGKVHMAAYKYRDCTDVNLVELFENEFGIPTVIANDAGLQMRAEKKDEETRRDSALLYIDYGMGGALWLQGANFEGNLGLAAELGVLPLIYGDQVVIYEDICCLNAMLGACGYAPDDAASFERFLKAYEGDGHNEVAAVDRSAHGIALLIRTILGITGCRDFIVSGKIGRLGKRYLSAVDKYMQEEKICDITGLKIRYARHWLDGTVLGAIDMAVAYVIDAAVAERNAAHNG